VLTAHVYARHKTTSGSGLSICVYQDWNMHLAFHFFLIYRATVQLTFIPSKPQTLPEVPLDNC